MMKKITPQKGLLFLGIVLVGSLIFYNTKDLFFGAPLSIQTAKDGTTVSDAFLPISGVAKHASTLAINGRIVAIDKKGGFSDGVVLSPGYNIVEITQADRFGKEKHKVFHLLAEPSTEVARGVNVFYQ